MTNPIFLKPVVNKKNGQINFSLKKSELPKNIKSKLSKLKCVKLDVDDLSFEDSFERKWQT
jgi:hypothetical protein